MMTDEFTITSILNIFSQSQSEAILERIERGDDFTIVTVVDPKLIAPKGVTLLCLTDMFQDDL
jgi:hypothetical protein